VRFESEIDRGYGNVRGYDQVSFASWRGSQYPGTAGRGTVGLRLGLEQSAGNPVGRNPRYGLPRVARGGTVPYLRYLPTCRQHGLTTTGYASNR
jgi:hypothetical protein